MRLIVTRPRAQAAAWVRELCSLGQDVAALPLIDIAALDDPAPLYRAWQRLDGYALVIFVSANAVQHFFAAAPAGSGWPAKVLAGSTGPGTSAALRAAGVPAAALVEPAADAPAFDSEALWAQVSGQDWAGRRVLVVRGEDGRDWLAETLRARGAAVDFVAAYRRRPPLCSAAEAALLQSALAAPAEHLWLFSSSEAVANLRALAPAADWSRSAALASHSRIVQAARAAGFGRVDLAAPVPAAVVALLSTWPARAAPIESSPQ
ncbi:MAG: uroporphyrinogen-III synthase [Rubrivivax sp.]|nr:uroporphyrinogen-III synthase [Rubrivivax sp.]